MNDAAVARMRTALRPLHDRVEQTIGLDGAAITRERYVAFLAGMLGFVEPCEARLRGAAGTPPPDLAARWKTPLLHATLSALGLTADAIARLPRAGALPPLDRWPAALGYLYVLEGSTLGGQVLLRALAPRLSLTEDESAFLRSYGPEVGRMWQQLLAQLASAMADPAADTAITRTARDTFGRLDDWYQSNLRHGASP